MAFLLSLGAECSEAWQSSVLDYVRGRYTRSVISNECKEYVCDDFLRFVILNVA